MRSSMRVEGKILPLSRRATTACVVPTRRPPLPGSVLAKHSKSFSLIDCIAWIGCSATLTRCASRWNHGSEVNSRMSRRRSSSMKSSWRGNSRLRNMWRELCMICISTRATRNFERGRSPPGSQLLDAVHECKGDQKKKFSSGIDPPRRVGASGEVRF